MSRSGALRGLIIAAGVAWWCGLACSGGGGSPARDAGTGGAATASGGGTAGSGGSATGGAATGGSATGGAATGGSAAGGNGTGGAVAPGSGGRSGQGGGLGGTSGNGSGGAGAGGGRGGAGGNAGGPGGSAGARGGAGGMGARCAGVPLSCGSDGASDCCRSSVIPAGTFNRGNSTAFPATISSFRLDTYEVSVGRFRQFVAGYPGNLPAAGSGKNPADANDPGWDPAWNASFLTDVAAFVDLLENRCHASTFTKDPGANEGLPMNCITWYEAHAFCIWDQGRLPTEAEWNYAAAGGAEQRIFPWSVPPESVTVDATYAVVEGAVQVVGSRSPKGDGKWGQSDLAGNVWEWVLDYVDAYPVPCADCAKHTTAISPATRADRGGSTYPSFTSSQLLRTTNRGNLAPTQRQDNVGVRCARGL